MAVDISRALSLISQRIVFVPNQVEVPSPLGRSTAIKRFREGLTTEPLFRQELELLGYGPGEIERAFSLARLERQFDLFEDRLATLREAYEKDIISFAEMKHQVITLIPDTEKALILVELYDFRKRPMPKPLLPEEPQTLTVGRILAAYKAGVITEVVLRAEMKERLYSPEDIDILVATETARLPKPKIEKRKEIALGDLRALFDLGVLSPQEFKDELIERKFSDEDAALMVTLQQARQVARMTKPKPVELAALPLGDLKAMFVLGIISEEELRAELVERKYSAEDIDREIELLLTKIKPQAA